MLKPEVWRLVLGYLNPGRAEYTSNEWRQVVGRSIVPEVKQETIRFYGTNDEPESKYPGLDYANPSHRMRLSCYPFHYQLFQAFDALRLTYDEIYTLCKWHGTKKVKDEHERKHSFHIDDTTLDDVYPHTYSQITVSRHEHSEMATVHPGGGGMYAQVEDHAIEDQDQASEEESEDEVERSVGVELNQRLVANAEANVQARVRGETVSTDSDWERWVKEAAEREASTGTSSDFVNLLASFTGQPRSSISDLALSLSQFGAAQEAAAPVPRTGLGGADAGETAS